MSRIPGSETQPEWDLYRIRIQVWNHVFDEDVRPYCILVRADTGNGIPGDFCPGTSFAVGPAMCTTIDGVSIHGPSGYVSPNTDFSGPGTFVEWRVYGESSYGSVPVIHDFAEFVVTGIAVADGRAFHADITVILEWYVVNALQAYPVASQTWTQSLEVFRLPLD